ncbi:MAG: ferritin [Planctomycetota bacterium]
MPEKKILPALNDHLQLELKAWYEYTGMALWLEMNDLPGSASFMKIQAAEELAHAQKIIQHLLDRDVLPVLPAIEQATGEYGSVKALFEEVLAAEQTVTASIEKLYRLAEEEDDQPARSLLAWFINEQVEEEAMARGILGRIRLAGESGPGLLMIDQELGQRQPGEEE